MYLRKVAISNFRVFPSDFSLDLTPGPGMTLLVGQNGLGKSTFFEALEWCLTGDVKRLNDIPSEGSKKLDFLAHRTFGGEEVDGYEVGLTFQPQTEASIRRAYVRESGSYRLAQAPEPPKVIDSLKSPSWREPILDLGAYLRLTHFLSQSGEQRFAAQDSKERWTALQSPAGAERLNRARQRLGNKGVTLAFNRRERAAEDQIKAAEAELHAWRDLLEQRDRSKRVAESGGALPPAELEAKLDVLWLDAMPVIGESGPLKAEGFDNKLRHLGERLDETRRPIVARLGVLKSLEDLPQAWDKAVDAGALEASFCESLAKQCEDIEADLEKCAAEISQKERDLSRRQVEREGIERRILCLEKWLKNSESIRNSESQRPRIEEIVSATRDALSNAGAAVEKAQAASEQRKKVEREFAAERSHHDAVRGLRELYSKWVEANNSAFRLEAGVEASGEVHTSWDDEARSIEADCLAKAEVLRTAEAELERLRFHAGALEAAVASIASILTDRDTQCPVCASSLPAGRLKQLASAASAQSADGLAVAEKLVDTRRDEKLAADTRFERYQARRSGFENQTRVARSARAAADALHSELLIHPKLSGLPQGMAVPDYLDSALAASDVKLGEFASLRRGLADVATLDKQLTDAEQARRSAESRHAEAQSHLERIIAETRRLGEVNRELLAQESIEPDRVDAALKDASLKEGECSSDIEVLGKQIAALQKRHREIESNLESLRNTRRSATKRVEESRLQLERLRGRWQGAGLQGDPSAESIQIAIDMINDRQQRLEQCDLRHGALVASYGKWIRSQEYRDLQQRVSEGMARQRVATEAAATEFLEARLAAARGTLESVRQAHQFRNAAIKKLEAEAKLYANNVLKPLDDLNKNFLQVFSCFSNITVSLGAKTRQSSSHLEFMLSWLTDPDDSPYASIRHFLSEGQLSALSVSLLLSMSTAYRWSRWRALVLDDPLQHNDVIQASSFIEVLRNLIREQGYQVLLSTHDYQLADFIRRKMAAANVDCRTCQFLGTRWQGVTHKVLY